MANEKDNAQTQSPALDAGLVRKANDAYFGAGIAAAATFPYTDDQMFRMANALRVAADAAYGAVIAAINAHENSNPNLQMWAAQVIASDVRARLLAPAKSAEERVKKFYSSPAGWCVVVDENRDHPLTAYKMEGKVADAYYAHVIATLKQEGKQ